MTATTAWFQAPDVVPAIPGAYEVLDGDDADPLREPAWQFWTGVHWGHRKPSPDAAEKMSQWPSKFQAPTWRGLTMPARECDKGMFPAIAEIDAAMGRVQLRKVFGEGDRVLITGMPNPADNGVRVVESVAVAPEWDILS